MDIQLDLDGEVIKRTEKRYGMKIENVTKFFNKAQEIQETPAEKSNSFSAYPQILTNLTFPHRKPKNPDDPTKEVNVWLKKSGDHSLMIKSGYTAIEEDGKVKEKFFGIPYGTIPRLVMAYITTEALRNESKANKGVLDKKDRRSIILGRTFREFLNKLEIDSTGGRNGSSTRVKDQMNRLFRSTISYQWQSESRIVESDRPITKDREFWWDEKQIDQIGLQNSYIVLDQDFYENIIQYCTPIDLRALLALKQSPLALDYYMFFTYKLSKLKKTVEITWGQLHKQFGSDYKDIKEFTKESKKRIQKVLQVYKSANVDINQRGRILLKPSPPHLPYKETINIG